MVSPSHHILLCVCVCVCVCVCWPFEVWHVSSLDRLMRKSLNHFLCLKCKKQAHMANKISALLLWASFGLFTASSLFSWATFFSFFYFLIFTLNAASADCQALLCLIFAAWWSLAVRKERQPHAETGSPSGSLLVNTSVVIDSGRYFSWGKTEELFL